MLLTAMYRKSGNTERISFLILPAVQVGRIGMMYHHLLKMFSHVLIAYPNTCTSGGFFPWLYSCALSCCFVVVVVVNSFTDSVASRGEWVEAGSKQHLLCCTVPCIPVCTWNWKTIICMLKEGTINYAAIALSGVDNSRFQWPCIIIWIMSSNVLTLFHWSWECVRHKQTPEADRINHMDLIALPSFPFVLMHMIIILFA